MVRDGGLRPASRGPSAGEAFTVYFGLLARIAPFGERDGRLVVRDAARRASPGARRAPGTARVRRGHARLGRLRRLQPLVASGRTCAPTSRAPYIARLARHRRAARDAARARRAARLRPARRGRLSRGGPDRGARRSDGDAPLVPEFVPQPRPDRARLRGRALLHVLLVDPGPVRDPARVRPVRLRLGPVRHDRLRAEHRAVLAEHRLVRPGRRARRRARRRAGGRARPGGHDPPRARRAALAVRDARADGRLHRRRAVAALAGASVVAHGGVGGAIVESLLVLGDRRRLPRRLAARAAGEQPRATRSRRARSGRRSGRCSATGRSPGRCGRRARRPTSARTPSSGSRCPSARSSGP